MQTSFAHSQGHKGPLTAFWLAVFFLIALGIGLAWFGASALRGQTTPSGLVIRTVKPGSGPLVTAKDAVLIDYEGRLPNGTVFDSSAAHGGPRRLRRDRPFPGLPRR